MPVTTATAASNYTEETLLVAGGKVRLLRGGHGKPLVVVHHDIGNPGWLPIYEQLAERYAVWVPDIPGYGQSERPEWARNVRDLAITLNLLLDALKLDSTVLMGLGFGGWLAAEMAAMNQSRLELLMLVAPAGIRPLQGKIFDQFFVSHEDYVKRGFHDARCFEQQFGELASSDQLVEWDINREMTTRVGWKPYMFDRALPHVIRSVEVPTLLVWGEDDRIVPASCGEQFLQAMPNARLAVVQGAGHWLEMEQPERLAELVSQHVAR